MYYQLVSEPIKLMLQFVSLPGRTSWPLRIFCNTTRGAQLIEPDPAGGGLDELGSECSITKKYEMANGTFYKEECESRTR